MRRVRIGGVDVSRVCIGGNPFSGFSHQGEERSREMLDYYTVGRIHEALSRAEEAGVNTFFGRTDEHIFRVVKEYWDAGGGIRWFAQVCSEPEDPDAWKDWLRRAADHGASALYIHGGVVDYWFANSLWDNFEEAARMMEDTGLPWGFAGHKPEAHAWIRDNLEADFQMCSHYNPTDRSAAPHHISEGEKWDVEDRRRMLEVIRTIPRPVVHYKVFAAGNRPVREAFEVLGREMRAGDAACMGFFLKDDPDMIAKDVALFEEFVEKSRS